MLIVTTSPLGKLSLNTDSKSLSQLQVLGKESHTKPSYQYVFRCRVSNWGTGATAPRSVIVPKHCLYNSSAAVHARVWLACAENHSCSEFASATVVSCLEQSISHQFFFLFYSFYNFFCLLFHSVPKALAGWLVKLPFLRLGNHNHLLSHWWVMSICTARKAFWPA